MARRTPEQEARYALTWDLPRGDLTAAAQLEYDRIKAAQEQLHADRKRRWADQEREAAKAGRSPFELPPVDGQSWTSDRLAISREWVAEKVSGKMPWLLIPYPAVSSLVPAAADGGIAISGADGLTMSIGKKVLTSLEACALLADGLSTNPLVASAAAGLLQPYLEAARHERDASLARRHTVDASGTTHKFCFHRRRDQILGAVCAAMGGAIFLVLDVIGPFAWHIGSWSDALWGTAGLLMIWEGIRAFRGLGVQVSGGKLTIRNERRTHTVDVSESAQSPCNRTPGVKEAPTGHPEST